MRVSKQARVGWILAGVGLVAAAVFGLGHWVRLRREDDFRRARLRRRIPSGEEREEMELAATAAVAVALAHSARRLHPVHSWHAAHPENDPSSWQLYARSQQIGQRKSLRRREAS
jgi:hypothetical protein